MLIDTSMSEYGCITNTRTFEEVAALYNTEMTGVFSGGWFMNTPKKATAMASLPSPGMP
jgi:Glucanosyltransferase